MNQTDASSRTGTRSIPPSGKGGTPARFPTVADLVCTTLTHQLRRSRWRIYADGRLRRKEQHYTILVVFLPHRRKKRLAPVRCGKGQRICRCYLLG